MTEQQPSHYDLMIQLTRVQEAVVSLRSDVVNLRSDQRALTDKVEKLTGDATRGKAMLSVLLVIGGAVGAILALIVNAANLFAGKVH